MLFHCRQIVAFAVVSIFGSCLYGQSPTPAPPPIQLPSGSWQISDQSNSEHISDSEQPELIDVSLQPDDDDVPPVIPESIIPARPQTFPASPLDADVVVTPNRTETTLSEVGSSVTVITGDQLRRSGTASVAEALRSVTGLDVVRQGTPGGLTSVFLRGANSQQTKVLLDGIPLNDPSNAGRSFDFSLLTVDQVERVEVLRGPQSVLYGSDAIGGVVNIVTRRGEGPLAIRATGTGGSFGTHRESLGFSGGNDRFYFSVGGSFWQNTGFSQASSSNGNLESDGYRNGTIGGRVGWTPHAALNVDYVFRYVDSRVQIDDFDFGTGLPIDNVIRRNFNEAFFQRIQVQSLLLDGAVEQIVGFNLSDYSRFDNDPGAFVPPLFEGQTRLVDWQLNALLTETNVASAGVEYYQEEALSSFQSDVGQNQKAAFIQDQFQVAQNWFATAGYRWTDHNTAGTAQTYRFTNRIVVDRLGGAAHGSIGTGFRAPSLAENLFQFGNPNLRPERSKGWDVGWEQVLLNGRLVLDATYFRNDFIDLIVFDFNTFSLQNVGRAQAHGVELSAFWRPNDLWLFAANYTYSDTEDLTTNQQLLRRPRNKANLVVERFFDCQRGVLRFEGGYVGDRLDTRNFILAPYYLLNASARYRVNDCWTVTARLENLLDDDYEEIRGYGVAEFSGYAGVEYDF